MNKIRFIAGVTIVSGVIFISSGCDTSVDRPPGGFNTRPVGSNLIINEVFTITPGTNSYSWIEINNPTNRNIAWMSKTTPATGYVVGEGGLILKTTDDGTTWTALTSGVASTLYSIRFRGPSQGWTVGANGKILYTTDEGATWTPQNSGTTTATLYSVYVPQSAAQAFPTIFAVGDKGTLLSSLDYGTTWSPSDPLNPIGTRKTFRSVWYFSNDGSYNQAYAVGDSAKVTGIIYTSPDGGFTWNRDANALPNYLYNDIKLVSRGTSGTPFNGHLIGSNGAAFSALGAQWTLQSTSVTAALRGSFFPTTGINGYSELFADGEGWACGDNGVIIKTYDKGRNWYQVTSGTPNTLNSIQFVDSLRGWAFGDQGTILSTIDGGEHWYSQSSGTTQNLYGSYFKPLTFIPEVNSSYALLIYAQRRYPFHNTAPLGFGANLITNINPGFVTKIDTGYVLFNPLSQSFLTRNGQPDINPAENWLIGPNGFIVFTNDSAKYYDHNNQVPGNPKIITQQFGTIPDPIQIIGLGTGDGFVVDIRASEIVMWTILPASEVRLVRYNESGNRFDINGIKLVFFDTSKTIFHDVDVVRLGNFHFTGAHALDLQTIFHVPSFWTMQNVDFNTYTPNAYTFNNEGGFIPETWSLARYNDDVGCTTCRINNSSDLENYLLTHSTDQSFYFAKLPIPGYGSQRKK